MIDAIPNALFVYDILLVILIFSIFLLSPARMIKEYFQRQKVYQQYLNAIQGTNSLSIWPDQNIVTVTNIDNEMSKDQQSQECVQYHSNIGIGDVELTLK